MGYPTKAARFVKDNLEGHLFAEPIFGDVKDDASGELKFNLGKIELTEKEVNPVHRYAPSRDLSKGKAVEAITQKRLNTALPIMNLTG